MYDYSRSICVGHVHREVVDLIEGALDMPWFNRNVSSNTQDFLIEHGV